VFFAIASSMVSVFLFKSSLIEVSILSFSVLSVLTVATALSELLIVLSVLMISVGLLIATCEGLELLASV
jgi:hypothetical protein